MVKHGAGTGAEFQDVGHGDEHEDGFADGLPDAGDCGADGCGENPAELDVVALKRLMGRRSAVAVVERWTLAVGARRGLRRRCRGARNSCLIPV